MKTTEKCEICGQEFSNAGGKGRHIQTTHPEKYDDIYMKKVRCDNCGKEIKKKKKNVSKYDHHFCNKECVSEWKMNDTGNYPKEWEEISRKVRLRDSYRCRKCGNEPPSAQLQVHHKDGDKTNNNLDNLITLCASCHNKEEMILSQK